MRHCVVVRCERGAGFGVVDAVECTRTFPTLTTFRFPSRRSELRGIRNAPIRVKAHLFEYEFLCRIAHHNLASRGPDTGSRVTGRGHIKIVLDDFYRGEPLLIRTEFAILFRVVLGICIRRKRHPRFSSFFNELCTFALVIHALREFSCV